MKTLVITTDERFARALGTVAKNLMRMFSRDGAIKISNKCENDRHSLTVKISNQKSERMAIGAMNNFLAKVITTELKSHYIQTNMTLIIPDEVNRHAFVRALCSFDKETDLLIAKSLIVITPMFAFDAFYDFCITPLKNRWREVTMLANENKGYLVCPRTFSELLRYLISNIDPLCDEAHVRGGEILLRDQCIPLEDLACSQDARIVSRLIDLAPRRIFIHSDCEAGLANRIHNLFGKNVVFA